MAVSPIDSPRSTKAAPSAAANTKSRLAVLSSTNSPAASSTRASSPMNDSSMDYMAKMNTYVRSEFVQGPRLGEGTYAVVYSGYYRRFPARKVAIKKIKVADAQDGVALDAVREIKFLQELNHPNIIKLYAVFTTRETNINLVLEHLPLGDLEQLWKNKDISYGAADIKSWALMLCRAVWFCHANFVLHRDIKGNNILIAADGTIKLADFGMSRQFGDAGTKMSINVITRFYRPPELLFGARHYGGEVDVWSVGVVIAELTLRQFFLPSATDIEQLEVITNVFGTATEDNWPGVSKLGGFWRVTETVNGVETLKRPQPAAFWRQRFGMLGDDGIDLLRGMMTMNPIRRLNSYESLHHRWFKNKPAPTPSEQLPVMSRKEGIRAMANDLKRVGGEVESGRGDKVARKLNFNASRA